MKNIDDSGFQQTLATPVTFVGIGLHSGRNVRMNIRPAGANHGIRFYRRDRNPAKNCIPALWIYVSDTRLSTTLENSFGTRIQTVEHILAALRACGIDNAKVEVDGPEVPIMDGSAYPFVQVMRTVGASVQRNARREAIRVLKPVSLRVGESIGLLLPSTDQQITVGIHYPDTAIGFQSLSVEMNARSIRRELVAARTFGFANQVHELRKSGLALGGSLNNAILIRGREIVNNNGLRYANEFVRHKMLDCIGDLALAGPSIMAHLCALKPSHAMNAQLLKRLFEDRTNFEYITVDDEAAVPPNPIDKQRDGGSGKTDEMRYCYL